MLNRYIDNENENGTVIDTKTGLIWLKDANCFGEITWEEANRRVNALEAGQELADGKYKLNDNSNPGDWRLPTLKEWEEMVDRKYADPALSNATGTGRWQQDKIFYRVSPKGPNEEDWKYWSSTPKVNCPKLYRWVMHLWEGGCLCYDKTNKENEYFVWPVRDPNKEERKELSDLLFEESSPPSKKVKYCKE